MQWEVDLAQSHSVLYAALWGLYLCSDTLLVELDLLNIVCTVVLSWPCTAFVAEMSPVYIGVHSMIATALQGYWRDSNLRRHWTPVGNDACIAFLVLSTSDSRRVRCMMEHNQPTTF